MKFSILLVLSLIAYSQAFNLIGSLRSLFSDSINVIDESYKLFGDVEKNIGNSELIDETRSYFTNLINKLGLDIGAPYDLPIIENFENKSTYDYIIVGAGSAGSVLAYRLSSAGHKVLLLESGGKEDYINTIPLFAFLLQKSPLYDWAYSSTPQKNAANGLVDKKIPIPRGRVVGGSSSINFMLYVRGNPEDYNNWAIECGEGWNFENMKQQFAKMENYLGVSEVYGSEGMLPIRELPYKFGVDELFLKACKKHNLSISDYNDYKNQNSFDFAKFTIDGDGRRCSTGCAYLSKSNFENLDIVLYSRALEVIINEGVARGVKFVHSGKLYSAFADNVILSAGAIDTPKLLMLSGIGPKDELEELGIDVKVDLPGVGKNLQDHPFAMMLYEAPKDTSFVYSRLFQFLTDIGKYVLNGGVGPLSTPGCNTIGFWKSSFANGSVPDIQIHQLSYIPGGAFPNIALGYILNTNQDILLDYFKPYSFEDGTVFAVTLVNPESRGSIKLASKNYLEDPIIDYNLLNNNTNDLNRMLDGVKLIINITKDIEGFKQFSSPLVGCDLFDFNSDDYLKCLIQTLTFTIYHPVGTAKMGDPKKDPMVVVDSTTLNVVGVSNLKVVDASLMPKITTGNTNAPTIAIAERAFEILSGYKIYHRDEL